MNCICPRCGADCTTDDGSIPAECDCGYTRYQEDEEEDYTDRAKVVSRDKKLRYNKW